MAVRITTTGLDVIPGIYLLLEFRVLFSKKNAGAGLSCCCCRLVGVGGYAGEDGCNGKIRNARPKTRGWLVNVPVVVVYISPT